MMNLEVLNKDKVEAQIKDMEEKKISFLQSAERQLAVFDGQLALLRWLIAEKEDGKPASS